MCWLGEARGTHYWSLVIANCQLQGTESLELWLAHDVPCRLTAVAALLDSLESGRPEKYPVSKMLGTQTHWQFGNASQNVCIYISK